MVSLHNVDCGSELFGFVLAAVWARGLPLIEAFLRLIKVEMKKANEFCGVYVSAASDDASTPPSIGAACLHACVQLGYYEGTLLLLNFGVPVDIPHPRPVTCSLLDELPSYVHTSLVTAVISGLSCGRMLDIVGRPLCRHVPVFNTRCCAQIYRSAFLGSCHCEHE